MKSIIYKIYTLLKFYPQIFQYKFVGFSKKKKNEDNKHNNILFVPFAPHKVNIIRESVFAYACKLRGARVSLLSCDLKLKFVDFLNPKTKKDLGVTYWITKRMYRKIGLPVHSISDYCVENDYSFIDSIETKDIENYIYKSIHIGDLIIASTVRYFYCNGPEFNNPQFVKALRGFLKTSILLIDVYDEILNRVKPDKIVMSHGIYVAWGTLFRLARNKNIPVDCYGGSYRKNTLRFYHNAPNAPFPDADWAMFKDKKLEQNELDEVNNYFVTRETQSEDSVRLFNDDNKLPDHVKKFIQTANQKNHKLFCLFTNISWDAFMFNNGGSFSSMPEWLFETIDYFKKLENVSLIIKSHPAEEYWKVPDKYRVKNVIPLDLPDNFLFIDERTKVKPFDLYNHIDYGLIYISTVCLEMAMLKIPVITAGVGGHYEEKGFTMDPKNKDEYFSFIESATKDLHKNSFNEEQAKRYLYFRFFREALFFDIVLPAKDKNKTITPEMLKVGVNKSLDIICNGILNDDKFYN